MTATHGGKGSRRRTAQVDKDKFALNWDRIFKNEKQEKKRDVDNGTPRKV